MSRKNPGECRDSGSTLDPQPRRAASICRGGKGRMEFRILGRLQVVAGGRPVALGGPLRERILAALVLAGGRPVSLTRLVGIAYDDPRDGLRKQVQNAI